MKKILLLILLYSQLIVAQSQEYISTMSDDSSRIIELKEVILSTVTKTPQQQLVGFYRANRAATLEEIISRLPELSLLRRGAYGMEPAIRSFSAGQINVLVDGMRIHGACTDKMDPATIYIEPINLQNLQVQTANTGFTSGSSVGGTLNMKIAEPDFVTARKLTGSVNSGYQSAAKSLYKAVQINFSADKWAIRASGTYRKNQNYRTGTGERVNFSQYEKVNYSISAKYLLNQFYSIKTDLLADEGWNIGYPALPMDVGYAAAQIGAISIVQENHTKKWYRWQAKVYANKIQHYMDDTKRPNAPLHMDMPGKSATYGAYFDGELRLNRLQRMLLKADASSSFLKASMTMYQPGQLPMYMLTWPDNRKDQYGVAVSWTVPVDSSAKLQINSRTDFIRYRLITEEAKNQVSIFGFSGSGRTDLLTNISIQLSKKINTRFNTSASLGYSERVATASELYGFYLFNSNDGYDYIGNPGLKREGALQAEISGTYNRSKTRIQLTLFYSRITHYIIGTVNQGFSAMTIGAMGVKSYVNLPVATITGLEATGIFKPLQNTEMVSTIRYNLGSYGNNQSLPFLSPMKNVTSFRFQPGRFSAQLESEAALKQNRFNEKAGEDATPGYVIVHLRLGCFLNIAGRRTEIQSGIENLLDKKYHEHQDWGNIARPGRNIFLLLKVIF